MIAITLNGEAMRTSAASVDALVREHLATTEPRGVAVAVNGELIAKARWPRTALNDGDHVELVHATQGG